MKNKLILLVSLIIIAFVFFYFNNNNSVADKPILKINNESIDLIVADDQQEREKGLGDRESMPNDTAMLFVFEQPDIYEFWMKDMKFPLDIVWLNENREVIHIKENAQPDSYPESFVPPQKALYVIELNAGLVSKYGIKVGNILNFKF
jgi:uncharacterized membrane protein (UPF0127 family)